MLGRVYLHVLTLAQHLPGERVELDDPLYLVAPELDPDRDLLLVGGYDLERVAAYAKLAARHVEVVALVLHVHELADEAVAPSPLPAPHVGDEALVLLRRAQPEDARDRGYDQDVSARQQRPGGGVSELVELLVDVRVFLDVGVGTSDVGLGLVVVVIADEVLDRVVGEELLELGRELSGQRLVVGYHERGTLDSLYDTGHRERLAAAGDAHQGLVAHVVVDAPGEPVDRLGLIARRLEP